MDPQGKMLEEAAKQIGETRNYRQRVQAVVAEQAEDEALWVRAQTAVEAYLQQALRRLHAVCENDTMMQAVMEGKRPCAYCGKKDCSPMEHKGWNPNEEPGPA